MNRLAMIKKNFKKPLLILVAAAAIALAIHFVGFRQSKDSLDVSNAVVVGRSYELLAPQGGVISESNVQPYSLVKKGQLAMVLNHDEYKARLSVALDQLKRALIGRVDACLRFEIAKSNQQSARAVLDETEAARIRATNLQQQGFVSAQAVEAKIRSQQESQQLFQSRRLEAALMYGNAFRQLSDADEVAKAISELRLILAARSKYFVYLPDDAFVYGAVSQAGDTVAEDNVLVRLVDVNTEYVEAYVLEAQVEKIKVGSVARVQFDSSIDQHYGAKVIAIAPAVAATFTPVVRPNFDSNWIKVSQRIPVVLQLDKLSASQRPPAIGTSAEVTFLLKSGISPEFRHENVLPVAAHPVTVAINPDGLDADVEKIAHEVAQQVLHNDATLGHANRACISAFTKLLNGRISK